MSKGVVTNTVGCGHECYAWVHIAGMADVQYVTYWHHHLPDLSTLPAHDTLPDQQPFTFTPTLRLNGPE